MSGSLEHFQPMFCSTFILYSFIGQKDCTVSATKKKSSIEWTFHAAQMELLEMVPFSASRLTLSVLEYTRSPIGSWTTTGQEYLLPENVSYVVLATTGQSQKVIPPLKTLDCVCHNQVLLYYFLSFAQQGKALCFLQCFEKLTLSSFLISAIV